MSDADVLEKPENQLAAKLQTQPPKPPKKPPAVAAAAAATPPFPVGARIRYVGSQRVHAGWQLTPALEPNMYFTVYAVAGDRSIISLWPDGSLDLAIASTKRADWVQNPPADQ